MKRIVFTLSLLCACSLTAQINLNDLLAAGIEDAQRYTTDYLDPAAEAVVYGVTGNWANTAEVKPLGGIEISIIGNLTFYGNLDDKQQFILDTADYQNIQFVDGSTSKPVASALGDIEDVFVVVEDENGLFSQAFELPTGLASENIDFLPSGYVQVGVGLIKGTEVKARFLPKISIEEGDVSFFGFALQHEFTKHLPADKIIPVAISALIGYTHFDGTYDFSNTTIIDGSNQRFETSVNTWVFQALVSTKLPVINFYGGLGYVTGKGDTDLLGNYTVEEGPFQTTYTDPYSVENDASGIIGNIGAKLKLGFFRLHTDYTLGQFNTLSIGLNFGIR